MKKLFAEKPSNYSPKSISEVDFDYDELNPWLRAIRQNKPMIKLFGTFISFSWIYVLFNTSIFSILVASVLTIILCYAIYAEKIDDELNGHLRPNETGEYWRARKAHLQKMESNPDD